MMSRLMGQTLGSLVLWRCALQSKSVVHLILRSYLVSFLNGGAEANRISTPLIG